VDLNKPLRSEEATGEKKMTKEIPHLKQINKTQRKANTVLWQK